MYQRLHWIERAADALAFAAERVLALALIGGITLNFVNVMGRYLFGFSLTGADEIEIYILIWIAFLGAAIVTWREQHLRMDVLLNACPAPVRRGVALFEKLVLVAIAAFVTVQSARYVERIHALGAVSDIAHVPTWIPHSAIAIGFGAIVLIAIVWTVRRISSPRTVPPAESPKGEPSP